MVFFMLILLAVMFSGAKLAGPGGFNTEYLDKKNTTAVNGIFVILVLFSHYAQYADFGGLYDTPYLIFRDHMKQMVVATFMFYSGFGMMEAIRKQEKRYVRKILSKFWQLLLKFDIAVLLFIAVNSVLGIRFSSQETLLAFTTWTAVGNSNWYITAILILYILMYLSFTAGFSAADGRRGRAIGLILLLILTAAVVYLQIRIDRPGYCYNTMMLLPVGCLYSELRLQIEKTVMHSDISYLISLTAVTGIYMAAFFHRQSGGIVGYTVWGIAFIMLVLLVTMKLSIYNGFLEWAGINVFGIYILQRLPMTVLDHLGYLESNKYMSLILVMVVTFAMAAIFQKYTDRLIKAITEKRKPDSGKSRLQEET